MFDKHLLKRSARSCRNPILSTSGLDDAVSEQLRRVGSGLFASGFNHSIVSYFSLAKILNDIYEYELQMIH